MYKSPVELFVSDIKLQMNEKLEEACYTAVVEYIPNVNREELLKALEYDRQQYEQGYQDAIREKDLVEVVHGRWIWKDFHGDGTQTLCCSECFGTEGARETAKYCSECGAMMDGERNDNG